MLRKGRSSCSTNSLRRVILIKTPVISYERGNTNAIVTTTNRHLLHVYSVRRETIEVIAPI
jgi:hypothetical protein